MLRLLHLSDLHFGPPYLPRVGEAVLREAEPLKPDIVVISGDFTQRAKVEQYREASAFIDRLPEGPKIVVPGNHDIPLYRVQERIFHPYALYQRWISSDLDNYYRSSGCVIVALNTTSPLGAITEGRIRRWQLDFVREGFRGAPPGVPRIVVAHHPLASPTDFEHDYQAMPRAREALDLFNEQQVDLILGGHLHRAYIGNTLDVYPGKDRKSGTIIVQSGTTTSLRGRGREREKNSYNVIDISADEIQVTHCMYFQDVDGFQPVGRHIFPRRHRQALAASDAAAVGNPAAVPDP